MNKKEEKNISLLLSPLLSSSSSLSSSPLLLSPPPPPLFFFSKASKKKLDQLYKKRGMIPLKHYIHLILLCDGIMENGVLSQNRKPYEL